MSRLLRLCIIGAVLATAAARAIAEPAGLDVSGPVDFEQRTAAAQDQAVAQRPPSRAGNPLWSIPLGQLSATRERPIFSPSRRPPPSAAEPPSIVAAPAVQEPAPSERPQLSLVGTVVNGAGGLAVFLDQSSNTPLRIRAGAEYQGWKLRNVGARSVTLQKGQDVAVFSFAPSSSQPATQAATSLADTQLTQTSPPLAQAGTPFLSPESRLLRMHQRQRPARRQL
ncbi:hypothetical protein S58_15960 [Bradyrhizobium oligotrophicum S58]|uniref:General secretion pathway protein N n=1 Tax=Bradyrhizobium oligotrophicum S58 TaxID=1245469 RepID=M4Z3J0_9BRAD|nr:hypothetical protein [Bradyrhizobium oligotrophicum]BAM87604.1 hypothetical protein S58_15960 [Bradyrhizobium oligotrophicum S58]